MLVIKYYLNSFNVNYDKKAVESILRDFDLYTIEDEVLLKN